MVIEIVVNGADPATTPIQKLQEGILTVNTDTAEVLNIDYTIFTDYCDELKEIQTGQSF
jgi:putative ABC transport system substrate-binding protein